MHRKNDAMVKLFADDDINLFINEYKIHLPTKQQLKTIINLRFCAIFISLQNLIKKQFYV